MNDPPQAGPKLARAFLRQALLSSWSGTRPDQRLTPPPEPRITSLAMVSSPLPAGGDTKAEEPAATSAIRRYEERLAKDPGSLAFAPLADAHRKAGRTGEAIRLCREGL